MKYASCCDRGETRAMGLLPQAPISESALRTGVSRQAREAASGLKDNEQEKLTSGRTGPQ